jgi:DNA mismatch repair ATPase MutS
MANYESNFKHPITYQETNTLSDKIIEDLELTKFNDPEKKNGVIHFITNPKSIFGEKVLNNNIKYTTENKKYLLETQEIIKKFPKLDLDYNLHNEIFNIWNVIKYDNNFNAKYRYIDYKHFLYLNKSPIFLQLLSVYNIASPILFFIVPFIMFLIPFFILKIKKLDVSCSSYFSLLKKVLKNHTLGMIFNANFKEINWGTAVYLLFTIGFYMFQIYQNIIACINFHKNLKKIHNYLFTIKKYLNETTQNIDLLLIHFERFETYKEFSETLQKRKMEIDMYIKEINKIPSFSINFSTASNMGIVMKHFYDLHNSEKIADLLTYSFDFTGYVDSTNCWQRLILEKKINQCKFGKKTKIKNGYYPKLLKEKFVSNDVDLNKNIVITGPNAAGKTTLIKGTVINLIFSQQIGCGFYQNAIINPYQHFHCYLNIPDTAGRDSLFQAEARQCKDILTLFSKDEKSRHFCIFDELYSGTNPFEAVGSAYGFLKYIAKQKNIDFMITTHYFQLCNLLKKENSILNKSMKITMKDQNIIYDYKLIDGISEIKGGFNVLKELEYPEEILNTINQIRDKVV